MEGTIYAQFVHSSFDITVFSSNSHRWMELSLTDEKYPISIDPLLVDEQPEIDLQSLDQSRGAAKDTNQVLTYSTLN